MKILGYTYYQGEHRLVMKCDSSLLNNRKPFFVPDRSNDVRVIPCTVVRICRLGKDIQPKFADRYYDAVAEGLDFMMADLMDKSTAEACAFDNSLCVGNWTDVSRCDLTQREELSRAIADASRVVTLRMGDLLYVDNRTEGRSVVREEIIETDTLYCKIK